MASHHHHTTSTSTALTHSLTYFLCLPSCHERYCKQENINSISFERSLSSVPSNSNFNSLQIQSSSSPDPPTRTKVRLESRYFCISARNIFPRFANPKVRNAPRSHSMPNSYLKSSNNNNNITYSIQKNQFQIDNRTTKKERKMKKKSWRRNETRCASSSTTTSHRHHFEVL